MGLVNEGVLAVLKACGAIQSSARVEKSMSLGEWLAKWGVDEATCAEHLRGYLGLPYQTLDMRQRLQPVTLTDITSEWRVWRSLSDGCFYCEKCPDAEVLAAFHARFPNGNLYLTDAEHIHSALLSGLLTGTERRGVEREEVVRLETLYASGEGHIDGVIARVFDAAVTRRATDLHLYTEGGRFHIDLRVDGNRETYAYLPKSNADTLVNKLKLLADMDIAEHRLPQDGHISLVAKENRYDLRLGTLPLREGEKLVIRFLPEKQRFTELSQLNYDETSVETISALLEKRQGLFLITGPTNSGKTTTMYAILRRLVAQNLVVYTIEDPVESVLPQVQQMQINEKSGFSFAAGLRGILRSDPDVIAIGELRDRDTVEIAARAALSGHLVIGTLHAFDAHQAVGRLRDLGLSNLMISTVLLAVINQRLVPNSCTNCSGSGVLDNGQLCPVCNGHGVMGQCGVHEIWSPTEEERIAIEADTSGFLLRQQAKMRGFETIRI